MLMVLLAVALVLGVVNLATASASAAAGSVCGAAGIAGALIMVRTIHKFVDSWDFQHRTTQI